MLPGDLVFDVGAHKGDKAEWFVDCGADVVCVEPQPELARGLEQRFEGNASVSVVNAAIGPHVGTVPLRLCPTAPTISTCSEQWRHGRFADYRWEEPIDVPMTTLDALVARFGMPRYVKIDVEGFESAVLAGLSKRVGILSFEFTSEFAGDAIANVERLASLGYRRFNVSFGESDRFAFPRWGALADLVGELQRVSGLAWGDVYAN